MRSPAGDQTDVAQAGCATNTAASCRLRIKAEFALLRSCEGSHDRKAWLFCGSELGGQRAAMVMSLVQSAKLSGHDPWAYLKDVLERLLAHPNPQIDELLPHRWGPTAAGKMPVHEEHRSPDR
jgi:hypothetical protein